MALNFRQGEILALVRAERRVLVEDLATRFDVTLQTIRRDLAELSQAGHLERVHGGAVVRGGVANFGYEERRRMNAAAKAAIGRTCAAEIPHNTSLFLNLGTTTEAVARALLGHRNITVVTNNINVANILIGNESCEVVLAGGSLRRSDGGLVGALTARFIAQFRVDLAVIGTSALDASGDLLDYDLAEVGVSQTIVRHAHATALVADASKLARRAPVRIASLADLELWVTDAPAPAALARACGDWGTRICVAAPDARVST
ncbi:MAG: DeoR family transcriptional regulator [Alphaproteobacteria bacterium HGW-Alphaproteobacteria-4]|nr:MAG: DeoR family transcriptional regulator [Alphaproteobacteria bacterium HGW-Alphaproteobacteria-4]